MTLANCPPDSETCEGPIPYLYNTAIDMVPIIWTMIKDIVWMAMDTIGSKCGFWCLALVFPFLPVVALFGILVLPLILVSWSTLIFLIIALWISRWAVGSYMILWLWAKAGELFKLVKEKLCHSSFFTISLTLLFIIYFFYVYYY